MEICIPRIISILLVLLPESDQQRGDRPFVCFVHFVFARCTCCLAWIAQLYQIGQRVVREGGGKKLHSLRVHGFIVQGSELAGSYFFCGSKKCFDRPPVIIL